MAVVASSLLDGPGLQQSSKLDSTDEATIGMAVVASRTLGANGISGSAGRWPAGREMPASGRHYQGAYDQSYENSTVRLSGSYSITIASAPVAHQL